MRNGLEIYVLVPPSDQMHLDTKKKKAESTEFSTGVEFQSHSSFGQVLGSLDLRAWFELRERWWPFLTKFAFSSGFELPKSHCVLLDLNQELRLWPIYSRSRKVLQLGAGLFVCHARWWWQLWCWRNPVGLGCVVLLFFWKRCCQSNTHQFRAVLW